MFKELFENKNIEQTIIDLLDKNQRVFVQLKDNTFAYVEEIDIGTVYFADVDFSGYKHHKYQSADVSDIKKIVPTGPVTKHRMGTSKGKR